MTIHRKIFVGIFSAIFMLGVAFPSMAGESKDSFQPGDFILDHIGDAYDWHVLTWNGHHVSVPLPIIVYGKQSGFKMFMSSKFHHGSHSYQGFSIAGEDHPNKGKIVEDATGKRPVLDLSISKNVFAIIVTMAIMLWVFILVAKIYANRGNQAPKGLQSAVEMALLFVRDDIARPAIGYKYKRFMPFLLTLFFFILISNFMGLLPVIPFGANVTGNIAVALILASMTFVITTFSSTKIYWAHIFNTPGVPWWLKIPLPIMPLVELMGVFIKPFVLMIRLFANITAGHIIVMGFFSLIFIFGGMNVGMGFGASIISVLFTVFMFFLELLVAFIQAYVFTLLSALYFGMAVQEHH